MLIKSVVLNRNESILQIQRDLFNFYQHSIFSRVNVGNFISRRVVNLRRNRRYNIARQVGFCIYIRRDKADSDSRRHNQDKNKNSQNNF